MSKSISTVALLVTVPFIVNAMDVATSITTGDYDNYYLGVGGAGLYSSPQTSEIQYNTKKDNKLTKAEYSAGAAGDVIAKGTYGIELKSKKKAGGGAHWFIGYMANDNYNVEFEAGYNHYGEMIDKSEKDRFVLYKEKLFYGMVNSIFRFTNIGINSNILGNSSMVPYFGVGLGHGHSIFDYSEMKDEIKKKRLRGNSCAENAGNTVSGGTSLPASAQPNTKLCPALGHYIAQNDNPKAKLFLGQAIIGGDITLSPTTLVGINYKFTFNVNQAKHEAETNEDTYNKKKLHKHALSATMKFVF